MNSDDGSASPLDSDLLRTFLAVARHGNVTRAADGLHRTQSAISVQIGRLEQRLDTKLFHRQARGVSLTESGESLRVAAERIVGELDRTAAAFCASPIGGQVRIGIPDEYGSAVLPDILAAFAARHPAVEVSVQCGFSTAFPRAIARGDLDLAVFAGDCGSEDGPVLFEEETLWVSAKGFHAASDTVLPLALFDRACWWRDAALEALDRAGFRHRLAYSSESVAGVKAAIAAGLAVGVLARSTVEPSMRVLGAADGLPALPRSSLTLLEGGRADRPAHAAMAEAIRQGFTKVA